MDPDDDDVLIGQDLNDPQDEWADEGAYDLQMNRRAARGDREATEWVYLNLK